MSHYYIKSPEDYAAAYRKSTEDPEAFWAEIAERFHWMKSGIPCCPGILTDRRFDGSMTQN